MQRLRQAHLRLDVGDISLLGLRRWRLRLRRERRSGAMRCWRVLRETKAGGVGEFAAAAVSCEKNLERRGAEIRVG